MLFISKMASILPIIQTCMIHYGHRALGNIDNLLVFIIFLGKTHRRNSGSLYLGIRSLINIIDIHLTNKQSRIS